MNNTKILQQIKDTREALLSLDEEKIKELTKKYNINLPEDPKMFWPGIHKAITGIKVLPFDFRMESHNWLVSRGFRSNLL